MTDTTLSLAARLAANLFVDAIKLAKPGARLAAKVGDRLLGGSPFNEREAQRFLLDGADALNEAEAQVDSLEPWWADGGPTEWAAPPPGAIKSISCPICQAEALADSEGAFTCPECGSFLGITFKRWLPGDPDLTAHEFNTMPNWPQSSAPVAPKPADADSPESTPAPLLPGVGSGHPTSVAQAAVDIGLDLIAKASKGFRWPETPDSQGEQPVGAGVSGPGSGGSLDAVIAVLDQHCHYGDKGGHYCTGSHYAHFDHYEDWRQHIAPLIVQALQK